MIIGYTYFLHKKILSVFLFVYQCSILDCYCLTNKHQINNNEKPFLHPSFNLFFFFLFSQGTSNPAFFVHADKLSSYTGSGTTWSDISGNGHHGTITGASFDPSNKVFVFDGNDKVDFPAVLSAGDDTYTLEAYFKNTSASGTQVVVEQNTLSSQANKRACMILLSNGSGGFNGQNNDRHSQLSYTSNQWEHWVIVANASSNVLKMYRNGSLSYNGTFANAGALNVGDGGVYPLDINYLPMENILLER